ncbi:MAG: penicillin-binding protein 2, partial [Lachnospiraceae bacterium]|nr:penicillin-binding protein 2 [Lachnospiraceae bacterium]
MNNNNPDVRTREEKRAARHRIYFVGGLFAALFVSMMIYICSYALTHQEELFENDYNGREEMLLGQNRRGTIYAADGQILAQTV